MVISWSRHSDSLLLISLSHIEFWSIGNSSLNLIIWWAWSSWNFWKWCINQKALCITDSSHWWLLAREIGLLISIVARFWWVWCFDRFRSCNFALLCFYIYDWWNFRPVLNISTIISKCIQCSAISESLSSGKWDVDAGFITYLRLTGLCGIGWWTWCGWSRTEMFHFGAKSKVWWILFSRL